MSFHKLPTEVLQSILRYAASGNVRRRGGILRVCKRWHAVGQTVLFEDIEFDGKRLRQFCVASLRRLKKRVLRDTKYLVVDTAGDASWTGDDDTWVVNFDLAVFFSLLHDCNKLKEFHFRCYTEVFSGTLASLLCVLSTHTLTTLVLDIGSMSLTPPCEQVGQHICPLIPQCFTSLKRLRLRMNWVCISALAVDRDGDATIESIVINLSFQQTERSNDHLRALDCGGDDDDNDHPYYGSSFMVKSDMLWAARRAVPHLPKLKLMRILYEKRSSWELVTVDCITGKRMILPQGADWEADGETDYEEDDESEGQQIMDDEIDEIEDEEIGNAEVFYESVDEEEEQEGDEWL